MYNTIPKKETTKKANGQVTNERRFEKIVPECMYICMYICINFSREGLKNRHW